MHSDWGDGRQDLAAVVRAAMAQGYRYIAICDRSSAADSANGLDSWRLKAQGVAICYLNRQLQALRVLRGVEVAIREDGSLDLEDQMLGELDIVVAAVHSGLNQSADRLTQRVIAAIESPHVDIIAPTTRRLSGRRAPLPLSMGKILTACHIHGKVIELNACPERLNLSDRLCRMAKEYGVKVSISTDAYAGSELSWMSFGMSAARRGGLSPDDVINTLSLGDLQAYRHRQTLLSDPPSTALSSSSR